MKTEEGLMDISPPIEQWLEEVKAVLDKYLNENVELISRDVRVKNGPYGTSDLSGKLEKESDGTYKIQIGQNNEGSKIYYYVDPHLVELDEKQSKTIGVKSLTITAK